MNNKQEDEIFCPECGKSIKRNAVICVHCGVQIKELATKEQPVTVRIEPTLSHKSKTTAVVLALFFGFWSWLYTFRKDQLKFWIFLGILIVTCFRYASYVGSSIASTLTNPYFDMNSYVSNINTFSGWILVSNGIGWFWALIDSIRRPLNFYLNYPEGE